MKTILLRSKFIMLFFCASLMSCTQGRSVLTVNSNKMNNSKRSNLLKIFKPKVMPLTLPSEDVPIASVDITKPPYNVKNDGSEDVTKKFQKAINDAEIIGGAVIFIPAGHYRFNKSLLLKETVVLRGEWVNPEKNNGKVEGTVFDIYSGRGNDKTNAIPFLSLERGSGVKNLSFWYPEQSIIPLIHQSNSFSFVPYPWTVKCNTTDKDGNNTTIINVTFVNSYKAIEIGPEWNELHYIKNIYGTPLKKGVWMDHTTDIGRIYNLHFAPKYWADSGLKSSPSKNNIKNWLQKNATGIEIGRSDWEYMYDVSLNSYKIGVRIIKTEHGVPNGAVYGLTVTNAEIGVELVGVESSGYIFTKSDISTLPGSNSYCVYAGTNFKTIVQFNSCTFGGSPTEIIHSEGKDNPNLTFQNCIFRGTENGNADIYMKRGTIAVLDSVFERKGLNFDLGEKVVCAQILDNKYPGNKPKIKNNSKGEIMVSQEPLNCKKLKAKNYIFPKEPKPKNNSLFSVTDFGAIGDGKTDDTKAIQKALDTAGKNGGGTVYIPAGRYKILTHLTVPTGVELRGIWDVPHHTISHGSVLYAYEGKGNGYGTPFISIEAGAGIRGLTVWYPEQSDEKIFPYPWTIRTKGPNCWIKDVALANAYQGADLATFPSAGHYVSYLCGAPLKTGILISNNSDEGWIESLQFNPHYWARNPDYPQPALADIKKIWEYQRTHLTAFKFGYCEKENNLGNFVYAALIGMHFVDDNGGCNSDIFLPGIDAVSTSIEIEKAGKKGLNFIANQLVVAGKAGDTVIKTTSDFSGKATFFNTLVWGDSQKPVMEINGKGDIIIQQLHSRMKNFQINGGRTVFQNIVLSPHGKTKPEFIFGSGIKKAELIAVYSKEGTIIKNKSGNKLTEKYNFKR